MKKENVTLYSSNGKILLNFEDVYLEHWNTNIYKIYADENKKELIMRIDKGQDMLLTNSPKSNHENKIFQNQDLNTIYGTVISQEIINKARDILADESNYFIENSALQGLGRVVKAKNDYASDKLMNIQNDYIKDPFKFDFKESSIRFDKKLLEIFQSEFEEDI